MQECFRKYPEIYGSELEEADAAEAEGGEEAASAAPAAAVAAPEAAEAAEILAEDRQQLRENGRVGGRNSDAAETDNLPGVKLVKSSPSSLTEEVKEQKKEN